MNARPVLERIAETLAQVKLDAVLVGNAAAALQGAPVTTLDFDFMIRDTPRNREKLKRLAKSLDAVVYRPYYPLSKLYRVVNDDTGLQLDFMPVLHGIRSFSGLRSRATCLDLGGAQLQVAALEDIIKSKAAAARPRDKAVLPVLERTLREKKRTKAKAR